MLTGASAWGTDWLGETKVVSPFTSQRRAGRGTQATGGAPADVGHLYSFGSTEEALHRTILGLAPRGLLHDPPFDHSTGKGRVAFHKGHHYDARSTKNNQVVPLIIEMDREQQLVELESQQMGVLTNPALPTVAAPAK